MNNTNCFHEQTIRMNTEEDHMDKRKEENEVHSSFNTCRMESSSNKPVTSCICTKMKPLLRRLESKEMIKILTVKTLEDKMNDLFESLPLNGRMNSDRVVRASGNKENEIEKTGIMNTERRLSRSKEELEVNMKSVLEDAYNSVRYKGNKRGDMESGMNTFF